MMTTTRPSPSPSPSPSPRLQRLALVCVAGGQGTRFQHTTQPTQERNKLLTPLHGKPCIYWALSGCLASIKQAHTLELASVVCVAPSDWQSTYAKQLEPLFASLPATVSRHWVVSGAERYDSVYQALKHLYHVSNHPSAPQPLPDWVMIHDAARPVVPQQATAQLLEILTSGKSSATTPWVGGSVGTPCSDTVKRIHLSPSPSVATIAENVNRHELMAVQTPQCFQWEALWQAHQQYQTWTEHTLSPRPNVTDDCHLLEHCLPEARVCIQTSPATNIKLTHASDVLLAEALLATSVN